MMESDRQHDVLKQFAGLRAGLATRKTAQQKLGYGVPRGSPRGHASHGLRNSLGREIGGHGSIKPGPGGPGE